MTSSATPQLRIPQATEAERAVLCACLASAVALADAAALLQASDFYSDAHRAIWSGLQAVAARGAEPDVLLLDAELEGRGLSAVAGGLAYLVGLSEALPDAGNVEHYARLVREAAVRRELLRLGQDLVAQSCQESDHVDDIRDDAGRRIALLTDERRQGPTAAEDLAREELVRIDREAAGRGRDWVLSGWSGIDSMTNGIRPGELWILAARPGVGKSALAGNLAVNVAKRQGRRVLFASIEMKAGPVMQRMIASECGVSIKKIRTGRLFGGLWAEQGGDRPLVAAAVEEFAGIPLRIVDSGIDTTHKVRSLARAQQLRTGLDLLIIDYLQQLDPGERCASETDQVSKVARALKAMAKTLDLPVIALSQLTRANERENRRPNLIDLRQSGSIEQEADVVLFIHRRVLSEDEKADHAIAASIDTRSCEVIVAKQRQGETGRIKFTFDGPTVTFREGI